MEVCSCAEMDLLENELGMQLKIYRTGALFGIS